MRMTHRILSQPPTACLCHPSLSQGYVDSILRCRNTIGTVPTVIADEVSALYWGSEQMVWDIAEDFPNVAPPFPDFFIEWNCPQRAVLTEGVCTRDESPWDFAGVRWQTFPKDSSIAGRFFGDLKTCVPAEDTATETWRRFWDDAKWIATVFPWMSFKQYKTLCLPLFFALAIDENGKCVAHYAIPEQGQAGKAYYDAVSCGANIWGELHVALLTASFMNCRNVQLADSPSEMSDKWHRRTKVPKVTFKTLQIAPMRKVLRDEGGSDTTGLRKALHICRGHFATYTEDRPLFGHFVGTVWKEAHVRGNAKEGVVIKDYSVKATS